jgi:predicted Zn-ribbon and HTH transcriptional regulator
MNAKVNTFLREIIKPGYHCNACDWEWIPRGKKPPKVCPHCKSYDWYKPVIKKGESD